MRENVSQNFPKEQSRKSPSIERFTLSPRDERDECSLKNNGKGTKSEDKTKVENLEYTSFDIAPPSGPPEPGIISPLMSPVVEFLQYCWETTLAKLGENSGILDKKITALPSIAREVEDLEKAVKDQLMDYCRKSYKEDQEIQANMLKIAETLFSIMSEEEYSYLKGNYKIAIDNEKCSSGPAEWVDYLISEDVQKYRFLLVDYTKLTASIKDKDKNRDLSPIFKELDQLSTNTIKVLNKKIATKINEVDKIISQKIKNINQIKGTLEKAMDSCSEKKDQSQKLMKECEISKQEAKKLIIVCEELSQIVERHLELKSISDH